MMDTFGFELVRVQQWEKAGVDDLAIWEDALTIKFLSDENNVSAFNET